jgi:outer membrane receptor protein involved in Fe transport
MRHFNVSRFKVVLFLLATSTVFGQSTGTIQGTVTDASGAAIAKASVTARNTGTGEQRTAQTDAEGAYALPSLTPGTYRLELKASGMQTVATTDLALEVGRTVTQNFTMKVASTSEVVEVTAAAPVIDSSSVSVSTVIDRRTVQEVPLNGRHFVDLGLLIPGSVTPPQNGFLTAPLRGQGSFAFNTAGNREDTVNFMINGINLNDMVQNQITFQPSINTVSEFKVDNSTYSAEYGRNSGAIVNIATRSGTNQWHGEAFEFLRNNALDARNFFNRKGTPQSPFQRNQFGAALGGPIWKDRTHFFFSYEGLRQRQALTLNSTVLTEAERARAQTIADPTVLKLLPLIPAPNSGSAFIGGGVAPVDIDQWTMDVSHVFNTRDRLHGYYALQQDRRGEPNLQGNTIPGFGDTRESRRQIFTLNESHVFSPAVVNEFRAGFNRIHITFAPNYPANPAEFGMNVGVNKALALPQMTIRSIGLNFGGPSGFPQGRGDTTAVLSDTLAWTRGKHNFKFGGEYRRFINDNFGETAGTMAFNTVDDFINGRAATFTASPNPTPSRIFVNAVGAFVTDQWKIASNLILDLGLRYDYNGSPTEAQDRFVVFDPATARLLRVGQDIDQVYKPNSLNFQPRVGFAWDVFRNGKTVVRSAYAYQVDQPITNLVSPLASNPPFSNPVTFNGPGTVTFSNAINAAAAAGSLAPTTVNYDFRNAYVQSWNFNIQQQLMESVGIMVGYFGNKGSNLRVARNLNQFINGGRPYFKVAADSPILPNTPLGNIQINDSGANSNYNALWVTATKRFSRGLQFNASYTWSKSIDYNSLNSQGIVVQDSYNIRGDRGLSDFDARHRFVWSGLYELPWRGNRLKEGWQLSGILQFQSGNPVNILTNNGSYSGVVSLRPEVYGPIPTGAGPAQNANVFNVQWFPASVCTAPGTPAGCLFFAPTNRFGNLGRNVLIGPRFDNVDLSLIKRTKIVERLTAEFRADVFDVLNHPNFGQPNRTVAAGATSTFGQITTTRFPVGDSGSSRQIQLAVKLIF